MDGGDGKLLGATRKRHLSNGELGGGRIVDHDLWYVGMRVRVKHVLQRRLAVVSEHLAEGVTVTVLGGEPRSDNVVTARHALNDI